MDAEKQKNAVAKKSKKAIVKKSVQGFIGKSITNKIIASVVETIGTKTDELTTQKRLSICQSCDKNIEGECSLCGCEILQKTQYKTLKTPTGEKKVTCDLDKW